MRLFSFFVFLLIVSRIFSQEYIYSNIVFLPSDLYGIVVSKSHQKLLIIKMKGGFPVVVDQMISVTGVKFGDKQKQGDKRTPSGVYFPTSFKPGRSLPSYYGDGAYPLNYPNALDRYIINRDGDGIWIHASQEKNLMFFSSKGCVILSNRDFNNLSSYIKLKKTPVVIQERFVKLPVPEFKKLQNMLNTFLEGWKNALIDLYKGNNSSLFSLYSKNFSSKAGTIYDQIKHYEKTFFVSGGNSPFVHVINKTALYDKRRSGEEFFVLYFDMAFLSGDEIKILKKVLYLTKENGSLKIITEENF